MTDTPTKDERSEIERFEDDIRSALSLTWGEDGASDILSDYRVHIVAAAKEAVAQRIEQNADVINGFAQPGREAQLMAFLIRLPDGVPEDGKEQQQ